MLTLSEQDRRRLLRTEWGIVHQNPRDGLRFNVSAGGNVGERLMAVGERHYGTIRSEARAWLAGSRSTTAASTSCRAFLGRHAAAPPDRAQPGLASAPRVHGRADRRARRLGPGAVARSAADLVRDLDLAAIIVTHDLAVARLLADRMMVMRDGAIVEPGLTDQVLDDPQHAYTQLLVSSVMSA